MARVSDAYKAQLKQKALVFLPRDMKATSSQNNILYMVEVVVPAAVPCRKNAEKVLWPKVNAGEMGIMDARKMCAEYLEKLAKVLIVKNLNLRSHNMEKLMKAWIALDSFEQLLATEESAGLRSLMDEIAVVIEQKETGREVPEEPVNDENFQTVPIDPNKIIIPGFESGQAGGDVPDITPLPPEKDSGSTSKRRVNPAVIVVAAVLVVALLAGGISIAWSQTGINNVTEAIEQIGTVTMESSGAIKDAELAYDKLSENQKAKVENYETLTAARAELDRLNGLVDSAVAAIQDIGTVSLGSEKKIQAARDAYDALEADGLTDYVAEEAKILDAAEDEFGKLYAEDLYSKGLTLFEQKKYDEALKLFAEIAKDYPKHTRTTSAKSYASKCMVIKAQACFDAGDYEGTMNLLVDARKTYGDSADNKELMKKLTDKLKNIYPRTGKMLKDGIAWGYGKLTITAGKQDACIKVVSTTDSKVYDMFFIRAGETFELKLADGDYKVLFGTGEHWYGDKVGFGHDGEYMEVTKVFSYTRVKDGSNIYYNARKLNLGGSVGAEGITFEAFWK